MKLINRHKAPIAMPYGIGEMEPGSTRALTASQLSDLQGNAMCIRWIQNGMLALDDGQSVSLDSVDEEKPEKPAPKKRRSRNRE